MRLGVATQGRKRFVRDQIDHGYGWLWLVNKPWLLVVITVNHWLIIRHDGHWQLYRLDDLWAASCTVTCRGKLWLQR